MYHTFSHYFSPFEITYSIKRSARNDVISRKLKRGCPVVFSPFNRCYPLNHEHLQENGNKETRCGLNCEKIFGTDRPWNAQSVKQRREFASVDGKFPLKHHSYQPWTCPLRVIRTKDIPKNFAQAANRQKCLNFSVFDL